jgi:hypothetical protein
MSGSRGDDVDRSPATEAMIARLIGTIAANAGLRPIDRCVAGIDPRGTGSIVS